MSDADPRVIRRLNVIIALLLIPYVVGAGVIAGDVLIPLLIAGVLLLGGLFLLAVFRTFGG